MTNVDEIERMARKYSQMKKSGNDAELAQVAAGIIDSISLPTFSFPLREETLSSEGVTTYIYENNAAYPELFDFLGEILHSKIPIEVEDAKFGPGEIIVSEQDKQKADEELRRCVGELKELVHARKSEILSKYAGTP
ncbi:MAG: hypothetical protein AB1351_00335 [Thermoproteota archaeon]